jgi:hypothetical protein
LTRNDRLEVLGQLNGNTNSELRIEIPWSLVKDVRVDSSGRPVEKGGYKLFNLGFLQGLSDYISVARLINTAEGPDGLEVELLVEVDGEEIKRKTLVKQRDFNDWLLNIELLRELS